MDKAATDARAQELWETIPEGLRVQLQAATVKVVVTSEPPPRGIVARYLRTERVIMVYRARLVDMAMEDLVLAVEREIGQALNARGDGRSVLPTIPNWLEDMDRSVLGGEDEA